MQKRYYISLQGLFLMKLGKFEEALKYCNYLIEEFPLNIEAYNLIGKKIKYLSFNSN